MISIIIPVYNKLDNLRAVFKCLNRQTVKNFEVIISDDGSSENVVEGMKDIINQVSFKVKYIWQADLGFRAGQARNNGVKYADNDILLFLDQDIIFPEYFIEKVIKEFNLNKILIYRTVYTTLDEKKKILEKIEQIEFEKVLNLVDKYKIKEFNNIYRKDTFKNWKHMLGLRKQGTSTLGLFVISKLNYIKINGFDEEFSGYGYEDIEFSNRVYNNGFKSKIINVKTLHLFHESLANTNKNDLLKNEKIKINKIQSKSKRAFYGLDNRKDKDEIYYIELN